MHGRGDERRLGPETWVAFCGACARVLRPPPSRRYGAGSSEGSGIVAAGRVSRPLAEPRAAGGRAVRARSGRPSAAADRLGVSQKQREMLA